MVDVPPRGAVISFLGGESMSSEPNPYAPPQENQPESDAADRWGDASMRDAVNEGPKGIGGWLILPLIGLLLTPFQLGFVILTELLPAFQPAIWNAVTTPGEQAYHPLWAPLLIFEVVVNVSLIVCGITLLILFLKKSRLIPKLMIAWLLGNLAVGVVDQWLGQQIPAVAMAAGAETTRQIFRSLIAAAIWVPYFLKSKRVKNTFVE
jgi:hypothetical protein